MLYFRVKSIKLTFNFACSLLSGNLTEVSEFSCLQPCFLFGPGQLTIFFISYSQSWFNHLQSDSTYTGLPHKTVMLSNKSVNCFVNAKCSSFIPFASLKMPLHHKQGRIQKGHIGSGHPCGAEFCAWRWHTDIFEQRLLVFLSCTS